MQDIATDSPLQYLPDPFPEPVPIHLFVKRDDQLHPLVSGNKWRKLKYNLLAAEAGGYGTLLTFGGAYSNHLYATAAAGQAFGFQTIGIVRGDELANAPRNRTLAFCEAGAMRLHFVSRTDYRYKDEPDFRAELTTRFGRCYVLPEGGTNDLAIRGTAEIMPEIVRQSGQAPDYVACSVGTGGTVAGLAQTAPPATTVLGFWALKGASQLPAVWLDVSGTPAGRLRLIDTYHFGGYAKTMPELLNFIRAFEHRTGVLLDPIYTGKLFYGIYDLARQGYFPNGATIVALHTGGLQGRTE